MFATAATSEQKPRADMKPERIMADTDVTLNSAMTMVQTDMKFRINSQ